MTSVIRCFEDFEKGTTACPIPGKPLLTSQAGPAAHPDWVGMSFALVLGVVGAFLGGWLGGMIFGSGLQEFFSIQTWLLAIVGSLIVLAIYGMVTKRSARG